MKIRFLGASGTVTGSKYLVETAKKKYLIDCGLFQGLKPLRLRNWSPFAVPPKSIDAVILTHAHLDHSGYLPKLVKEGFQGPIYSTISTRSLCEILLNDSAYLMEEDANYANRKGFSKHKPALPLYTHEDVKRTLPLFVPSSFLQPISLDPQTTVEFQSAGHILGAAQIRLRTQSRQLLFSGDLGRPNDPMMKAPAPIGEVDSLVVESTYGNRTHEKMSPQDTLETLIQQAIEQKGIILIPAFAVGRSQIILHYLSLLKAQDKLADIPIFLDSPMATNVTDLYCTRNEDHKLDPAQCRQMCSVVKYVLSPNESEALDHRKGPMLIISASGMLTGGRVLHHLKSFGSDEKNILLFTGYQAEGTRGADIIAGKKSIKIHGEFHKITAQVKTLNNLSAHADAEEILSWIQTATKVPKQVFITHGESEASSALKTRIEKQLGWPCVIPEHRQSFTLE